MSGRANSDASFFSFINKSPNESFGLSNFYTLYIKNISTNEIFSFRKGLCGLKGYGLYVVIVIIVDRKTKLIVYTGNGMDPLDFKQIANVKIRVKEYTAFSANMLLEIFLIGDHFVGDIVTEEITAELFGVCAGKAAEKSHIVFFKLIQNIRKRLGLFERIPRL